MCVSVCLSVCNGHFVSCWYFPVAFVFHYTRSADSIYARIFTALQSSTTFCLTLPFFLCIHCSSHTSMLFHPPTHCVSSPTSPEISTSPVMVPCLRCSTTPLFHPCLHLCCTPAAAESRENSFSRSRSSSVSSIDRDTKEAITTLQFGESYGRKGDAVPTPCLWVGTSLGVVLLIPMSIATDEDERMEEPVAIGPSGRSQSRTAKAGYV